MPSVPSKNPVQRLEDIVENIDSIREFTAKMNRTTFVADQRTLYSVIRALEIISEATKRLPVELKSQHSEIDWLAVAAAGNVYRHEYEVVDGNLLWNTVQTRLGTLRAAQRELERLREDNLA